MIVIIEIDPSIYNIVSIGILWYVYIYIYNITHKYNMCTGQERRYLCFDCIVSQHVYVYNNIYNLKNVFIKSIIKI